MSELETGFAEGVQAPDEATPVETPTEPTV